MQGLWPHHTRALRALADLNGRGPLAEISHTVQMSGGDATGLAGTIRQLRTLGLIEGPDGERAEYYLTIDGWHCADPMIVPLPPTACATARTYSPPPPRPARQRIGLRYALKLIRAGTSSSPFKAAPPTRRNTAT